MVQRCQGPQDDAEIDRRLKRTLKWLVGILLALAASCVLVLMSRR